MAPFPAPTARLRFREFRPDDFAAVHAYAASPEVTRYTSFGPNTEAETRAFLARTAAAVTASPRVSWTFAMEHAESGALVGGCGLELADPEGPAFSLGYVLAPEWWGQGYATEAAGALLRFGFEALAAERLFALVFVGNEASERVLRKAGLGYESEATQGILKGGTWHAVRVYAMRRKAWQEGEK
ncbi:MAG TPA: GNAT family N-acetyltransferase [Gemmatimonadales bacterium]